MNCSRGFSDLLAFKKGIEVLPKQVGIGRRLLPCKWMVVLAVFAPIAALWTAANVGQQARGTGQQRGGETACAWSFDFGAESPCPGHTAVQPTTAYNQQRGYGFVNAPPLDASSQGVCSNGKPFLFSVDVPEGN